MYFVFTVFCLLGFRRIALAIEDHCVFQPRRESVTFLHTPDVYMYPIEHDLYRPVGIEIPSTVPEETNTGKRLPLPKSRPMLRRRRFGISLYRTTGPPPCASSPCVNGGCSNSGSSFSCSCNPGWTGRTCSQDVNECNSNPCQFGFCNNLANAYSCTCDGGYLGSECQTEINECASSPCVYGSCYDHVNSYSCSCYAGYEGTNCQIDINECQSNPCLNGASCNDHVNRYSCTCTEDYTDSNCETDMCYPHHPSGADVSVILDDSSSQDQESFERQKEFLKSLIYEFPIGTNEFRFSVTNLASSVQFGLNDYLSNVSLANHVTSIQYSEGVTDIHEAMSTTRTVVFNNITPSKAKYLITFSDGLMSNWTETLAEVERLKIDGFTLISVGFGRNVLHQGLIDSATDYQHVFGPTTADLKQWLLTRHTMEQCPDCSTIPTDVFLLLETSSRLGIAKFYGLLNALKTLLVKIPVSTTGVHVNFATFSDSVDGRFDFTAHFNIQDIIADVISVSRVSGSSNQTAALKHIRDNVFLTSTGYRQGYRKIAVLFISEVISDLSEVVQQADALKAENVTVVVVTVSLTSKIDVTSLKEIVSDPAYLFVYGDMVYGDNTSIYALLSLLQYEECIFD